MKYEIQDIKVKTIASLNKKVAEATLKEVGTDKVIEKVQVWQEFPSFDGLTFGSLVEGDVVEKEKNGYKNFTLYAPKTPFKAGEGKGAQMTKVMEKKQENITHSMDRKEAGIETSSTFRDATAITVEYVRASGKPHTLDQIREIWIKNRKWLLQAYGDYNYGTKPPVPDYYPETDSADMVDEIY